MTTESKTFYIITNILGAAMFLLAAFSVFLTVRFYVGW
jgi:hypothetical protein